MRKGCLKRERGSSIFCFLGWVILLVSNPILEKNRSFDPECATSLFVGYFFSVNHEIEREYFGQRAQSFLVLVGYFSKDEPIAVNRVWFLSSIFFTANYMREIIEVSRRTRLEFWVGGRREYFIMPLIPLSSDILPLRVS